MVLTPYMSSSFVSHERSDLALNTRNELIFTIPIEALVTLGERSIDLRLATPLCRVPLENSRCKNKDHRTEENPRKHAL